MSREENRNENKIKRTIVMICVNKPYDEIQRELEQRIASLPDGHEITHINYATIDDFSALVGIRCSKQIYNTVWREYINTLFGMECLYMLSTEFQMAFMGRHSRMFGRDGRRIFERPNGQNVPVPAKSLSIDSGHAQPAKRTKVVGPEGQIEVRALQQTTLTGVEQDRQPEAVRGKRGSDPFKLPEDGETKLKDFLKTELILEPPLKTHARKDQEGLSQYVQRVKHAACKPTKGVECVFSFLPVCLTNQRGHTEAMREIPMCKEHAGAVQELARFFSFDRKWSGFFCLFPFPDLQEKTYNYSSGGSPEPKDCVIELVRRALALEGAVSRWGYYIYQVWKSVEAMSPMPIPPVLHNVVGLLRHYNFGIFTRGEGMWEPMPDMEARGLPVLEGASSGPTETLKCCVEELRALRGQAFNPRYVCGTQIGWLLPRLAFVYKHRELLAGIGEERKALEALEIFQADWARRAQIYAACMEPLRKYGEGLTRLLELLASICPSFGEISGSVAIPNVRMTKVSDKGDILDELSMQKLKGGHYGVDCLLLPFPNQASPPLHSFAELDAMASKEHETERDAIMGMLAGLGVDPDASPALKFYLKGNSNVGQMIRCGDTQHLPPTASMPRAAYNPKALYADGAASAR